MSNCPKVLSVSAITTPTDLASRTSATMARSVRRSAAMSLATELQSFRSVRMTLTPSAAGEHRLEAAFGPAAAPVTIATFFVQTRHRMCRLSVGWVEQFEPPNCG